MILTECIVITSIYHQVKISSCILSSLIKLLVSNCLFFNKPIHDLLVTFHSSHHPDMLSMDREHRRQATKDWSATCCRLWGILQRSTVEALGREEASLFLRTGIRLFPPLIYRGFSFILLTREIVPLGCWILVHKASEVQAGKIAVNLFMRSS